MSRVPAQSPLAVPGIVARRWARRARRSPAAWWSCAAVVAVLAVTRVGAWGESRTVVVASGDLPPGHVVTLADVTVERWPVAVVPAGALADVPVGRTVTTPIVAGEAVVARRVAPDGLDGVAALLPEGHRAVAVPAAIDGFGAGVPPLAVGDRVDVLATFDVYVDEGGSGAEPTGVVAAEALVVDVGDGAVTVAVPERDAPQVAFAAARGTVTLALVGMS